MDNTKELILFIAKTLVSKPNDVRVEDGGTRENARVYNLIVADGDKGLVIGKQGRIAKAIRTLARYTAGKNNEKVFIDIV